MCNIMSYFFFFSSRRRHTRFKCDWSSDVCSSDLVRDELPHSLAVTVEEMLLREDRPADRPLLDVHATLYVERPSQKAIVIGQGGERLRDVGSRARKQIEALLGTPVFLDLHVKVAKDW